MNSSVTKDEQERIELINLRMLNQRGINELAKLGIYKILVLSLSINDLHDLETTNIYFNFLFSPASQNDLKVDLKKGSKIITIDINSLKAFTSDDGVAIILHEIGHAFNSHETGETGEFAADDYAVKRGFGNAIISSLEKCKSISPAEFVGEMTEKRIERIRNKIT